MNDRPARSSDESSAPGPDPSGGEEGRSGPPARRDAPELGRGELDRIIRRATELQFASGDGESGERLPEEEVLRIGREVGLATEHLRRAIGEVRAEALLPRPFEREGVLGRMVGPAGVVASRVVPGRAVELDRALEEYLSVGESLRRVRKRGGRSRWEAEEGVVASLQRGLRWGGRSYELARAASIELHVEDLEEGFALVSLVADLHSRRAQSGWGWIGGLGLAGAGAGFGIGLAVGLPVLIVPMATVGLAGGVAAGRQEHVKTLERMRLAMEGILDRLESGEALLSTRPPLRDRLGRG